MSSCRQLGAQAWSSEEGNKTEVIVVKSKKNPLSLALYPLNRVDACYECRNLGLVLRIINRKARRRFCDDHMDDTRGQLQQNLIIVPENIIVLNVFNLSVQKKLTVFVLHDIFFQSQDNFIPTVP